MSQSTWVHVCPSWTAGPRSAHPKFGGGLIINGFPAVEDRLLAIKERFPSDRSSGHIFHEVRCPGQPCDHLNGANAIGYLKLVDGMEKGRYPLWSAMTSPAFGWRGCENGVILSSDPATVAIGKLGHQTAIQWSQSLFNNGLGLNHNIWWPAFDAHLHRGPLSKMSRAEACDKLIKFWMEVLQDGGVMKMEYKPSVPGQRDWFPTMHSAIEFCQYVNRELDRKAMFINLEWAHALIGGQTVVQATQMQIQEGLFDGFVHVNSAELAVVKWNGEGYEIEEGTPGDDIDWPVGEGGEERWADQREAVRMLDKLGITITAEHDIDPAGENPMECYERSRANLEKMVEEVRSQEMMASA